MSHGKDTRLVTSGRDPKANFGIVNPPVYHASTVTFSSLAELREKQRNRFDEVFYGRYGTPTTRAFEDTVAALEGGFRSIAMPSGLAAVAGTLLALLKTGDHLLMVDSVYAPTRAFCDRTLKNLGIETSYYDPRIGADIVGLIRANTRVVFAESPGSLTFEVQDLPAIGQAAHAANCVVVLDNTWSAGYYLQPFSLGIDVSIQAATKYLVGHSDAMLGTVTTTKELYYAIKEGIALLGYAAAPDDCYLGLRGMRSLAARLQRHQQSALKLARWLTSHPLVARVLHPGLEDSPDHALWRRDFSGASGLFGVILKEAHSEAVLSAFLDNLELFAMGFSWGGFESLIIPVELDGIRSATSWPDTGSCFRLSVGLEDPDDLCADLNTGFRRLQVSG